MAKLTAFLDTKQLTPDENVALAIKARAESICEKCPGRAENGTCFYSWSNYRITVVCPKLRTELGIQFHAVEEDEDGEAKEGFELDPEDIEYIKGLA